VYLLLIALALSPVYLWRSGLPQISHLIATLVLGRRLVAKHRLIYFEKEWAVLLYFLGYCSLVAIIVYIGYADLQTLLAPLYYIFGFIVFVEIVTVFIENKELFLVRVLWLHLVMLAIVTFVSSLGLGRIDVMDVMSGGIRMMFAFNNPNQMANWAIWVAVIVSACGWTIYRSWIPGLVALILSAVVVGLSLSRAGFVGIFILAIIYICLGIISLYQLVGKQWQVDKKMILMIGKLLIVAVCFFLLVMFAYNILVHETTNINLLDTIINRILATDLKFELGIRAYDRLMHYPQYLIFGAGEGATYRFADKSSIPKDWNIIYEIHSSWAGLLFNYGLIGFLLFALFLFVLIKRIDFIWLKLFLLGPFFFGFSNYNIRNWYFWVGIAIIYCCSLSLQDIENRNEKQELVDLSAIGLRIREKVAQRMSRLR